MLCAVRSVGNLICFLADLSVLPLVVAVEAGIVWGSGIILTPRTVLTCGHVVQGATKGTDAFAA